MEHVERVKTHGYTVLRGVLSADQVEAVRERTDARMAGKLEAQLGELEGKPATGAELAATGRTISIGGRDEAGAIGFPGLLAAALEVAELLIRPFLLNPSLLDLAERIMGPDPAAPGADSYTLVPTMLAGRQLDECGSLLRDAEQSPPFSFTKGQPVLRIPEARAAGFGGSALTRSWQPAYPDPGLPAGHQLFDLTADPRQSACCAIRRWRSGSPSRWSS